MEERGQTELQVECGCGLEVGPWAVAGQVFCPGGQEPVVMVEGRVCVGVGLERVVGEERGWLVRSDW